MSQSISKSLSGQETKKDRIGIRSQYAAMVKDKIMRTAARLFVKQGYSQTTMAEIAEAVGMSKANLYNYVQSKDDFTFLVLDNINQRLKKFMDAVASLPPETTATERLCEAMRGYAMVVDESQEEYIFLHHAVIRHNRNDRKKLFDSAISVRRFFKELLLRGLDTREFQFHDPELLSANITNIIGNWVLDRWYWSRSIPLEGYITKQTELVLRQLGITAAERD